MSIKVQETILSIKQRISTVESDKIKLSETDTRQGLINPMFSVLGWNFGDFMSVKSELRHKNYNDPVDYAFFSSKDKEKPILLLEAKALGKNLDESKIVKQLCMYLGEMGVQWGVLSDGNKYVMYNSEGGSSFEDHRFITLTIKDVDTEDGMPVEEFAEKMVALLSRDCLENNDIQTQYEDHMVDYQIEAAIQSLLSKPFDTLAAAIQKEFKEERVKTNENLRVTRKRIIDYLKNLADEDGAIPLDLGDGSSESRSNELMQDVATIHSSPLKRKEEKRERSKRISVEDLLKDSLIHEGDNWRLQYKGETFWARITGNGELEVNGKNFSTPSKAGTSVTHKPCTGWNYWYFKTHEGQWEKVDALRSEYKNKHGLKAIKRSQNKSVA